MNQTNTLLVENDVEAEKISFRFYVQTEEKDEIYRRLNSPSPKHKVPYQNGIYHGELQISDAGELAKLRRTRLYGKDGPQLKGYWLAQKGNIVEYSEFLQETRLPFIKTNDGGLYLIPEESYDETLRCLSLTPKSLEKAKFIRVNGEHSVASEGNGSEGNLEARAINAFASDPRFKNYPSPLLIYNLNK